MGKQFLHLFVCLICLSSRNIFDQLFFTNVFQINVREGTIKKGESRDTCYIRPTRHRMKTNKTKQHKKTKKMSNTNQINTTVLASYKAPVVLLIYTVKSVKSRVIRPTIH